MLKGLYVPHSYRDYFMVLAAVALAGAVSFLLVGPLARGTIFLIRKCGYRRISWAALCVVLGS